MKKLLSVVAVAAIVTSAFAFTNRKIANFCVRNAAGNACIVLFDQQHDPNGVNYLEWPLAAGQWNGNQAACQAAAVAKCSVPVILDIN